MKSPDVSADPPKPTQADLAYDEAVRAVFEAMRRNHHASAHGLVDALDKLGFSVVKKGQT